MGSEQSCTLEWREKKFKGKALLETEQIVFRGDTRLAIPFKEIKSVDANDGILTINGDARFHVGPKAEAWAEKIRNPKSRLDKLGVKSGQIIRAIGVDREFVDELRARDVAITSSKQSDIVFYAADTLSDLARLPKLKAMIKPDGAIWIIRPKGVKTITERDTMAAGKTAGLVDVKVVKFSETHTAEKFVIPRNRR